MQSKMMAYDRVVSELNTARFRGTSYPIVHALIQASLSLNPDVRLILANLVFALLLMTSPTSPAPSNSPKTSTCSQRSRGNLLPYLRSSTRAHTS